MKKTDWSHYYTKPYITALYSSRIINNKYLSLIKKYLNSDNCSIAELGGGDSKAYGLIDSELRPSEYHIVDNNQSGLDKIREKTIGKNNVFLHNLDVLNLHISDVECDIVLSGGLIEHFSVDDTRNVILSHIQLLKRKGILIIGYPTPTFLYRLTRKISELLSLWIFHDERPLKMDEVADTVKEYCDILEHSILWRIFLTQAIIVARKR
jgi:SAM-dependent methyltransferase